MNPNKDLEHLIEVGRIWLAGSPYSKLADNMKSAKDICDEWRISNDSESAIFAIHENSEKLCGLRYENVDANSMRWVTEVVGAKINEEFWVSIQLGVDSELPVEKLAQGKRPHILKTIMQEIGGGMDGAIPVSDKPLYLEEQQLDLAIDVITANAGCVMPVVYVSVDNQNKPYIDAEQLAKWLSGMAHVMIEPTRKFSFDLMPKVYGENAYGGAVAIYWPDGIGKWLYIPKGEYADPKEMQIAVARKVRLSLLSQRTKNSLSWGHIQELRSKKRIRELKESGSDKVEDYIAAFDEELNSKNEEIQRLEQEINRLKYGSYENSSNRTIGGGINLEGKEKDLYQGERVSIVLDALENALGTSEPHSRRSMVLDDLITTNTQEGQRSVMLDELKELLRTYDSMTSSTKRALERLGFEVFEEGKHHKLIFRGDNRYPFILAKTGSDHRGGLNAFSDLKKKLF